MGSYRLINKSLTVLMLGVAELSLGEENNKLKRCGRNGTTALCVTVNLCFRHVLCLCGLT